MCIIHAFKHEYHGSKTEGLLKRFTPRVAKNCHTPHILPPACRGGRTRCQARQRGDEVVVKSRGARHKVRRRALLASGLRAREEDKGISQTGFAIATTNPISFILRRRAGLSAAGCGACRRRQHRCHRPWRAGRRPTAAVRRNRHACAAPARRHRGHQTASRSPRRRRDAAAAVRVRKACQMASGGRRRRRSVHRAAAARRPSCCSKGKSKDEKKGHHLCESCVLESHSQWWRERCWFHFKSWRAKSEKKREV